MEVGTARDFEVVRNAARSHEPDRYVAALLAPRSARADLIALAAFAGEINRIAEAVSDPHLAEIRLQWWIDAVGLKSGSATGHPIADAFNEALDRHAVPRALVETWLTEFATTLYAASPESEHDLDFQLGVTEGSPFMVANRILGTTEIGHGDAKLISDAGIGYGLARLGLRFPYLLARNRMPLPAEALGITGADVFIDDQVPDYSAAKAYIVAHAREALERLQPQFAHASTAVKTALLPLALVEPYLRALQRQGHDIKTDIGDVAPVVRAWRIWRAHMSGRI